MADAWANASNGKRITMVFSAVGVITAAIIGTSGVAKLGEPYWLATRGYVLQVAGETRMSLKETVSRQISIEIRIEDADRRRIKAKIDELNLELAKNPNASDSIKRIINDQIEQNKDELERKEEVIRGLRRLQFPGGG